MTAVAHDEPSRFVFTLATARPNNSQDSQHQSPKSKSTFNSLEMNANPSELFVTRADFMPMMMDIIDSHTGLHFLKASPQFHSRYCEVVS